MWSILRERKTEKQLEKAPSEIQARFEKWRDLAEAEGPLGLLRIKGFRDHSLKGEWAGARSSYLNDQWRVIYVVIAKEIKIIVMEVTPHDYRKKG